MDIFTVIIIAVVVVVLGLVGFKVLQKKNPAAATQVADIAGQAGTAASAVASQAVDALHSALINAQGHLQQSMPVVRKPPEPAQNAPLAASGDAPAAAASQAADAATTAPAAIPAAKPATTAPAGATMMTSGEPNDPGYTPEPARTDMWGRPVLAAPFGRNNYGAPFDSMEARRQYYVSLAIRDANNAQLAQNMTTQMATGPFDPKSLTDADCFYLMRCAQEMTFDPRQLASGPFYGADVARLGSQKYESTGADFPSLEQAANPSVANAVRQMAQGAVNSWMAAAFPEFASPRWKDEHLAAWAAGWRRLHPGQEP